MKIFVVRGSCVEYSDFRSWEVRAFIAEAQANALRDSLNAWCAGPGRERHASCPLDPAYETDSGGTTYDVWSIEAES